MVINRYRSPGREGRKREAAAAAATAAASSSAPTTSTSGVLTSSRLPEATCCPPRFWIRARASVSPADIQSSVIHEASEGSDHAGGRDEEANVSPSRHWLQPQSTSSQTGDEVDDLETQVIELKKGDLGTPSSDLSSLSFNDSPKYSSKPKRPRLRRGGRWARRPDSESTDLEAIRSESMDSVDSQSHPEPGQRSRRDNSVQEETETNQSENQTEPGGDKQNVGLRLPFEVPDAEHGRLNYYALSPVRY